MQEVAAVAEHDEVVAPGGGEASEPSIATRIRSNGICATCRFSTPEELATLVALLASPRTANVTGANSVIDGGLVKTT